MKKLLATAIIILLFCGCVQEKEMATTSTTTSLLTTTTSTTSTTTTTTSSTTTTTLAEKDMGCHEGCLEAGFLSGICRKSRFECEMRLEKKLEIMRICPERVESTCCCQTNESIDKNVTIRYNLP